jgi:hypothetical protein
MKRNVKTLSVYIGEEKVLSLIKNTPALRSYFRDADKLIVGENLINVNHYDFSQLINSQLYGKAIVKEIN